MISNETKQALYQIAYVEHAADHYEIDPFFGDHVYCSVSSSPPLFAHIVPTQNLSRWSTDTLISQLIN